MKHEWRKKEKAVYLPKAVPEFISIPAYQFLTIEGEGNPDSDAFSEYIGVLYSLSYAIKMSLKSPKFTDLKPEKYYDYTVYPLEGVWSITEEAQKTFDGTINKDDLVFKLMIRQPDFIDEEFVEKMKALTKDKKPQVLLDDVKFEKITEGRCVQMLHVGSFDDEPESFKLMEAYSDKEGLSRVSKVHREVYLSDFRKVATEKLKTILRFQVK